MNNSENKSSRVVNFLPGATIFLVLVIYFNIRSGVAMNAMDWAVIGIAIVFFVFAVIKYINDKNQSS